MHSGTQSHTVNVASGSKALSKTPIRRSWLQVRLHMEMIDSAIEGLLPELTPSEHISSEHTPSEHTPSELDIATTCLPI